MGYTRKRRVYNLTFDGGEYDGMQVRVRGLTVAQLEDVLDATPFGAAATSGKTV